MAKAILEGGSESGTWTPPVASTPTFVDRAQESGAAKSTLTQTAPVSAPSNWQTGAQTALKNLQSATNKLAFTPVKTIVNQYGEKVQVDKFGRDAEGNLVIAAETPEDTAARAKADRVEKNRTYIGTGKDRMLVITYSDGTEEQIPAPLGELPSDKIKAGGPTLAMDTFKSTLALFFGKEAMSAAWVNALYDVVTGFYKTGSTINDSLNLALQKAKDDPVLKPFKDRFKGVFDLQERLVKGESVYVPTIAEYVGIQNKMAETLNSVGLGSLATQDFTGTLIGKNVSPLEMSNRVNNAFIAIDQADAGLKKTLSEYYPTVSRNDLAKALLLGDKGAVELEQQIKGIQVKSAAEQMGLVSTDPFNIAKSGVTYAQAKAGYSNIAQMMPTAQKLSDIYGQGVSQAGLEAAQFNTAGAAEAQMKLRKLARQEESAFRGTSGVDKTSLGGPGEAGLL